MLCKKCGSEIPDNALYCHLCGKKQIVQKRASKKARGNGTGSVYQLTSGKWRAVVTLGYVLEDGKLKRLTHTRSDFTTKKAALAYLPYLAQPKDKPRDITFKALYDAWLPTHRAGKSTIDCYKAAVRYFRPLWMRQFADIDIDDLQECMDDCPKGKRTRENMKALCGLLYKYAIPRKFAPQNLNLAQYLVVGGEGSTAREGFTPDQLETIRRAVGTVPYADYIYCMCYLGFRPGEFLELDAKNYDRKAKCFTGGAKTEAGKNRVVTISPKIQPIIASLVQNKVSGPVFCDCDGNSIPFDRFRDSCFYPALKAMDIDNPIQNGRHKYTPHSCRHTFATLLKSIDAPAKDKMELIGHTSEEMLRYYQDVRYDDLKRITDAL